jgi:hypothetical protein
MFLGLIEAAIKHAYPNGFDAGAVNPADSQAVGSGR